MWSTVLYPHPQEAPRGGGARRMRQAADGPPTTVLKAIVVKVTRESWEAMIDQYDRCHSSTSNPPEHQTDEE